MTPYELALVLLSALLHATWSATIKDSREPLAFNVLQIAAALGFAAVLLPLLPLRVIPAELWSTLAATGVAHGLYFYWLTRALETGELSLVYPIARSTPAFLPLVALPLCGESISLEGLLGIGVVVAGIWFVHASRGLAWTRLGSRAAAWAYLTLGATIAYSLLDKLAMTRFASTPWPSPVPPAVAFYFLLVSASAVVFTPLAVRRLPAGSVRRLARTEGRRALAAAAVSFLGYALILETLQTAVVSYVVAVRQTSVLFALALAAVWLRERPDRLRVLGGVAIVAGVALIALSS